MSQLPDYEKMDLFYLGREIDPDTGETTSLPLLYKNKYLTTHGVILGMTGSGKTGLGIALLEEAALDRIPAIIIDPKGDMANLLLSFPRLAPEDFAPWIDPDKARQKSISPEELAAETAQTWRDGLAAWDQDGKRIERMHEHADFRVYTPGSTVGEPVSALGSLQAPPEEVRSDGEVLSGMVNAAVSSLLVLVGIKADPLKSRQHILLASILLHHWRLGEDLDLESLIASVVKPPFDRVGVFPLESFYGRNERMELAMQLNNILASPSFTAWSKGNPLDIDAFLYSRSGKPCQSIFSIAHLSDEERMFFVTLLLGRLLGWMRRQQGASGLRCLLYMDEIFGFFPPNANPPAKKAMLLLLKQARAFGLGIVLSTQNPVDLDYKGLSNIGTWCVGRLQTRQDQDRVLAGIAGSTSLDKAQLRKMLANMRGRTFLLSSTHLDEPVLFETRWVLSYLKGPL
ncbi:MAG: ATP-binding protein, partial [Thermodesulfobacteria bacterium]|nr:ATP-binding protein [Thermodesulfobacteriota bacterium]